MLFCGSKAYEKPNIYLVWRFLCFILIEQSARPHLCIVGMGLECGFN